MERTTRQFGLTLEATARMFVGLSNDLVVEAKAVQGTLQTRLGLEGDLMQPLPQTTRSEARITEETGVATIEVGAPETEDGMTSFLDGVTRLNTMIVMRAT